MPFTPFELERWQSTYENRVRHNLSESGVHPFTVGELLAMAGQPAQRLLETGLGYPQGNGSDDLRRKIAALYPGATADQVVVTTGSAEANFDVCWRLIEPGDRIAVLAPTYMQVPGLARNFGAHVSRFHLRAEHGWEPDPDELRRAIAPGTRLVLITNPNNPTGRVLSAAMRSLILDRVKEVEAWLLADEVYQGAERDGSYTASFWGSYDKVIVVNGLSKAYGLPGLRIGWIVTGGELARELWARHDYTVIAPTGPSDLLARLALEPEIREKILQRTRTILNTNYPVLDSWLRRFGDTFTWRAPDAGAICFARYRQSVGALDIVERLRVQHSVLLVPGEHFEMPNHLRIGYGQHLEGLVQALAETEKGLRGVFD
jgi:aspartate/methionine/tyrosine aminotransferase